MSWLQEQDEKHLKTMKGQTANFRTVKKIQDEEHSDACLPLAPGLGYILTTSFPVYILPRGAL